MVINPCISVADLNSPPSKSIEDYRYYYGNRLKIVSNVDQRCVQQQIEEVYELNKRTYKEIKQEMILTKQKNNTIKV